MFLFPNVERCPNAIDRMQSGIDGNILGIAATRRRCELKRGN
jgi:hypothetical protein